MATAHSIRVKETDRLHERERTASDEEFSLLVYRQHRFVFRVAFALRRNAHDAEDIAQTLHLHVTSDISSMSTTKPGSSEQPVIRQTTWDSNVTVPINKPTLIFSSDNSADKGKTELELTAVPIGQ